MEEYYSTNRLHEMIQREQEMYEKMDNDAARLRVEKDKRLLESVRTDHHSDLERFYNKI